MVKTQVQIPDHLYHAAKLVAADYEMSFAEVVRRGLERVTQEAPGANANALARLSQLAALRDRKSLINSKGAAKVSPTAGTLLPLRYS